jgi:hypothetical protein
MPDRSGVLIGAIPFRPVKQFVYNCELLDFVAALEGQLDKGLHDWIAVGAIQGRVTH